MPASMAAQGLARRRGAGIDGADTTEQRAAPLQLTGECLVSSAGFGGLSAVASSVLRSNAASAALERPNAAAMVPAVTTAAPAHIVTYLFLIFFGVALIFFYDC
jgi:hypothetical protein